MIVLCILKNFMIKLSLCESHHILILLLLPLILLIRLILVIKVRSITNKATVQIIILEATYNNDTTKMLINLGNNLTIKSPVKYVCKAMLLRNVITCKLLFHRYFIFHIYLIPYIILCHLLDFYYHHHVFTLLFNPFNIH